MTTDGDGPRTLSPEAAFSVLSDQTRLEILTVLGKASEPLVFSELFERVDYDDSANFNYHLQQLLGHFVREVDDGYTLRHAGGRVVQAILSGTVTENPVVERTAVDRPCFLCGGDLELSYREERIALFCPDCGGTRGEASETVPEATMSGDDIVAGVSMPPLACTTGRRRNSSRRPRRGASHGASHLDATFARPAVRQWSGRSGSVTTTARGMAAAILATSGSPSRPTLPARTASSRGSPSSPATCSPNRRSCRS
jgi:hypothetical protein